MSRGKEASGMTADTPNPGSDDARKQGCVCPVLDNAHGRGAWGSEGDDAVFWIRPDCTVHGSTPRSIP